jgi:hypothetical protein
MKSNFVLQHESMMNRWNLLIALVICPAVQKDSDPAFPLLECYILFV